jgi:hypothetical protein
MGGSAAKRSFFNPIHKYHKDKDISSAAKKNGTIRITIPAFSLLYVYYMQRRSIFANGV